MNIVAGIYRNSHIHKVFRNLFELNHYCEFNFFCKNNLLVDISAAVLSKRFFSKRQNFLRFELVNFSGFSDLFCFPLSRLKTSAPS